MSVAEPVVGGEEPAGYTLADLLRYFLRLGTLGFGGPIALCGYMQRDLVEQRGWISPEDYKQGLALAQLAPGPLAAQLAIYLGWVRARVLGATLAGVTMTMSLSGGDGLDSFTDTGSFSPTPSLLMGNYIYESGGVNYFTFTFAGLSTNKTYMLYGMGNGNASGQGTTWWVDVTNGHATASATANYASGTTVTLTATPAFGSTFTGWSGCDAVSGTTCTVTMSSARSVTASFLGIPPILPPPIPPLL